ncbi:hypothetical protein JRO89_XS01G0145800 [Xanthoceras sorbifolium]|uniref:Uncharacterized protein n=1 Tax=Xanthoceras sorbifolium TaxID=99658 RepID=A0ABQ8IK71_9ROSI|nr:hypothetical protein JRO89_XS01G0145800 [Xanthoceras sorbifolium]
MEILSFGDLLGPITSTSFSFPYGTGKEALLLFFVMLLMFFLFDGGQDRGGDLRIRLDRRLSLQRRYPPGRDARGRDRFRGHSPSRSLENSDGKRRKKHHDDGQSDFSGSLKILDGIEDQVKERKITSSDSKFTLREKLKEVQSDINTLDHRRLQLEIDVEEKIQEADILTSRIEELETQLHKEKEEGKRIASKIKKFVKAHNRHSRIQDDLKRQVIVCFESLNAVSLSQARLQKLGYQLGSDASGAAGNEEDSSINIVSDGETTNYHLLGPKNDMQTKSSPNKRKLHAGRNTADVTIAEANLTRGGGHRAESRQFEKPSRWNVHPSQSNVDTEVEAANNGDSNHGPLADESKSKGGKNVSAGFSSADKVNLYVPSQGLASGLLLTSMAAHAITEEVEMDSAGVEKGTIYEAARVPFKLPPPPPIPQNVYFQLKHEPPLCIYLSKYEHCVLQYEGDDENVDVDGLKIKDIYGEGCADWLESPCVLIRVMPSAMAAGREKVSAKDMPFRRACLIFCCTCCQDLPPPGDYCF